MKEHPILFSGPMVRAIREGRKTMTRRVIKFEDLTKHPDGDKWYGDRVWSWRVKPYGSWTDRTHESLLSLCPYGQPGDRLWVRETWKSILHSPGYDNGISESGSEDFAEGVASIQYLADGAIKTFDDLDDEADRIASKVGKVRPSIFMPRWASRLLLEVTAVRVERVQEISEDDAKAEGAEAKRWGELKMAPLSLLGGKGSILPRDPIYRYGFYELWDSINAKRGYGWDANPWIWVIEFKKVLQ
jgi:hypothetical protein